MPDVDVRLRGLQTGDPTLARAIAHDVGPGSKVELRRRAGLVGFDALDADLEARRNFLVGVALGCEPQYVSLTGAQFLGPLSAFGSAFLILRLCQRLGSDGWIEINAARCDGADRVR